MADNTVHGKFEYNGKVYPFFLADQIITVPQAPHEFNSDFANAYHFDYLKGVTDNNKYIFFLDCDLVGGALAQCRSRLQLVCKGYVLSNSAAGCYDRIEFASPALNGFYSPRRAIEIEHDEVRFGARGLTFKNYEDTSQNFSCTINEESINCTLAFRSSITLKPEDSNIGSVNTTLSMKFSEPKSVTDLPTYYLYLLDFLVFTNFRADVPIDDISLYGKIENEKYTKLGTAKFFQLDCSQYSADNLCSISYNDLPNRCLPKVFSVIAERRGQNCYNPFFIPSDGKDARYFDSAKWLITAISFEGEFNRRYSDFKYETDEKFKTAKDLLLRTIDDAVKESGLSINNKTNAAFKSFRSLVGHSDTTIREKFQFCLDKYKNEITPLLEKYIRMEGVDKDIDLAQAYADYRNSIAHGSILPISEAEKITFQLMRCFIYILVLECGEVPYENIKEIVKRMF